jgi:hypothetical protein
MSLKVILVLAAMIVIFSIVRALKSDTAIPWTVPPKWRPVLAVLLGQTGAVVLAIVKAKFPALPLDYTEIFGIGAVGSGGSSLLNGLLESAKAPPAPLLVKSVRPPPLPSDATPPGGLPPAMGVFFAFCFGVLAVVGSVNITSCNPPPAKTAAAEKTLVDSTKCIEQQLEANPQAAPEAVALACSLNAIPDVISLIFSKKADFAARKKCSQPVVFTVDAGAAVGPGK